MIVPGVLAPFASSDGRSPEQHPEAGPVLLVHHAVGDRHLRAAGERDDGPPCPLLQLVELGILRHGQGELDGDLPASDPDRADHAGLAQGKAELGIDHRGERLADLGFVDRHEGSPRGIFPSPGRLRDVSSTLDGAQREPSQAAAPRGGDTPDRRNPTDLGGSTGSDSAFSAAVTAVTAAFGDPTRREIYLFVRSNPGTTASEVAERFSLHPNVARHHLERLATGGYLEVTMERTAKNGAGRPSKRFRAVGNDPTLDLLTRRDDLLVLLLQEALQLLGPLAAEDMAERVGEQYGRTLAGQMSPGESQRSLRTAMHAIAETLTAHGFAAHAEEQGAMTAVVADNCPFGDAASQYPVLCAVDRGMVKGLLAGLCGEDADGTVPVVLSSSRARGDDACAAVV